MENTMTITITTEMRQLVAKARAGDPHSQYICGMFFRQFVEPRRADTSSWKQQPGGLLSVSRPVTNHGNRNRIATDPKGVFIGRAPLLWFLTGPRHPLLVGVGFLPLLFWLPRPQAGVLPIALQVCGESTIRSRFAANLQ